MALTRFARALARKLLPGTATFEQVEREERKFYRDYLCDGMVVFDVGANVGALTLLFSRLAGSGTVHAFEASKEVFGRLDAALAASGRSNVIANALALSDARGIVRLHCYDGPFHAFNSMADRPLAEYGVDAGPVRLEDAEATTIDDYCEANGIGRIDLLKIDVEGAELQVLKGARTMIERKRIGCVVFEFGQATFDMGNKPAEIAALFRGHGYRLTNLVKGDRLFPGGSDARSARFAMHVALPR